MQDESNSSDIIPGTPPDKAILAPEFVRLSEIIAQLRSPEGCPWDREQTLESIKPHTLEETYELLEAIDSGDDTAIVEELGDVLLQVLLDAQIGADTARFNLIDVVRRLSEKMISRHPHVFGDVKAKTAAEGTEHWNRMKAAEQAAKRKDRASILDS